MFLRCKTVHSVGVRNCGVGQVSLDGPRDKTLDEVWSMRLHRKSVRLSLVIIGMVYCLLSTPLSEACTRVVYLGPGGNLITARSMDWKVDVGTILWILPRGISRRRSWSELRSLDIEIRQRDCDRI